MLRIYLHNKSDIIFVTSGGLCCNDVWLFGCWPNTEQMKAAMHSASPSQVAEQQCTLTSERKLAPLGRSWWRTGSCRKETAPRKIGMRPQHASLGRFVCAESAQDQALWLSVLNRRCSPQSQFFFPKDLRVPNAFIFQKKTKKRERKTTSSWATGQLWRGYSDFYYIVK